uniref:Uncharacterized protein n=1 Tax=Arundo donax TaxID=35708 RepID=A0A0A8YL04_ARUDO
MISFTHWMQEFCHVVIRQSRALLFVSLSHLTSYLSTHRISIRMHLKNSLRCLASLR